MALYAKDADKVVLVYTKAEAEALNNIVQYALPRRAPDRNGMTAEALHRSAEALRVACEPHSRSGASIK